MSTKPNVGLVGVGHLGRIHLQKLQKIETCNFVGFYDIDLEKSRQINKESGAYSAESLQDMLEKSDIISVVVPTHDHHTVGKEVLQSGKHLFMEKPLTETAAQAEELVKMAEDKGLKFGAGHIERFNPAVQAMAGKIGNPMFIEAHRLNPFNPRGLDVAVISELMIHDIDLCLYFTQSEVTDIQASAVQVLSDKMDIANARLTFESGCVANLTASRISPSGMRKIRLFQRDNYLSFDLKEKKVDSYSLVDNNFDDKALKGFSTSFQYGETGKKIVFHKPECSVYDMIEEELRRFIDAVVSDSRPPVTGEEGLAALKVALEIERNAHESLKKINSGL
ncbi:MAG: Gfo/Idh/MocA family oxidoreductase [candidate division Zixibacteria bacterium]|nr:Gfo/Idh/MocA family oxidoreductase [candidate division Zixibacteria bacterium]NIR67742.1 Gfo/Idh/MocA family oxidoreductase [candidate division Zixibacteria bacterium]NIS16884.1 Gfo/Idh/MocA family oxidoreductase [candidate division Zixibacteria bacterium]NIS48997.1 Gfo/Idh/MocA family oxidoreductase [candidate division Zixibacteria bacterium]NIT53296.1 Gfo/Idh/MocA family oxidoreductase [candidate division Zixibacteria bacterium]